MRAAIAPKRWGAQDMKRIHAERLVALLILLFSLAYFVLAFAIKLPPSSDDSPFSARTFPLVLGPLAMALALALVLKPPGGEDVGRGLAWGRALGLLGLMALYALAIDRLGFVVTSALFLAGGFYVLGERRQYVLLPIAAVTALAFWIMFTLLDVQLDWGVFGRMF
jgi:putative tricarboxylic transport membrane protein